MRWRTLLLVAFCGIAVWLTLLPSQQLERAPEERRRAQDLLSSPNAAYLSQTGRRALEVISGYRTLPNSAAKTPASAERFPIDVSPTPRTTAAGEVMVNNP